MKSNLIAYRGLLIMLLALTLAVAISIPQSSMPKAPATLAIDPTRPVASYRIAANIEGKRSGDTADEGATFEDVFPRCTGNDGARAKILLANAEIGSGTSGTSSDGYETALIRAGYSESQGGEAFDIYDRQPKGPWRRLRQTAHAEAELERLAGAGASFRRLPGLLDAQEAGSLLERGEGVRGEDCSGNSMVALPSNPDYPEVQGPFETRTIEAQSAWGEVRWFRSAVDAVEYLGRKGAISEFRLFTQ